MPVLIMVVICYFNFGLTGAILECRPWLVSVFDLVVVLYWLHFPLSLVV
jgi:hypothetical protein